MEALEEYHKGSKNCVRMTSDTNNIQKMKVAYVYDTFDDNCSVCVCVDMKVGCNNLWHVNTLRLIKNIKIYVHM